MPVTRDIVATYRGPGRVVRRLMAAGQREDRVLATLMAGCVVTYVAQWPRLARQAHVTGEELQMLLGSSLLALVMILPLLLYALSLVSHLVSKVFGGNGTAYGARLALFWAVLAASPVLLLWGLVAGFIGHGPALTLTGAIWLALFLWFWISGQRVVMFMPPLEPAE